MAIAGADDQADELGRLDGGGDEAAGPLVEVEHLLVQQRRRATTKPMSDAARNGSDHQIRRSVSIFQTMRHASANDGAGSSVATASPVGAHGPALVGAPDRLLQPQREHDEDEGRDGEDEERRPPAERGGEQAGGERADERADGVGGAVEREHPGPGRDVVVVGEQRVVGRVDDGLAEAGAGAGDAEHEQRRWPGR